MTEDEDGRLRAVALQNAQRILQARQRDERELHEERERLRITLASIGDAVISTDAGGRIVFLNGVAETLTGWPQAEAAGRPLADVFQIIDEQTRRPVENPAARVLREGHVIGLANHTILIARDGTERPIGDSAAPIRDAAGNTVGVVLVFRDVSERRHADVTQARLAAIVESSDDAIVSKTLDGIIRSWNAGAERVFGYTPAEAIGRPITMLIPPEHLAEETDILSRLRRGERIDHFETVRVAKGGRRLNISLTVSPIRDAAGQIVGASKVARDITDRKRAEAAVRESEDRYRTLFTSIDVGFCVLEMLFEADGRPTDYRFLECNPAFERHTGLRDAVGKTARTMVPNLDEFWIETYGQVARTGEPARFLRDAPAMGRWFDVYAFKVGGPDSCKVGLLFNDITDRKRAEDALREGEERLRLAVEIARMGTFEIDLATDSVVVNEPGRAIYGWPSTHTKFAAVQAHFHPDDTADVLRQVEAALDPAGPGEFEVEHRIYRVDGALRWIRVRGRAAFHGAGASRKAVRLLGAYLDVTDRRQMEDTLRETDRKKDDFIALLAHELRNPLAPVRNGLQVMRLAADDPHAVAQARAMMDRQLGHMVRLIDDLLDVSRIGRNKMELRRARVLLADVVGTAVETARPALDGAGHTLTVSLPPDPMFLDADLTRLAQVFSNLLTNSAKYTEPGGRVWFTAERHGAELVVRVRDTGIGIPAAALPTLFDMFSQVDRSIERSTGGLGIGLALVKGLTEMHGGTVTAESPGPGKGSTFTVRLPVPDDQPVFPLDTRPEDEGRSSGVRRRMLVVDDNQDAAESMGLMLEMLGHEVRTAHDGVEALEAADAFRPQVVLMDVGMPRLNGLDATRRLRERPWGRETIVIALTGWGQDADRERSRAAGCDGHLVKPVSLSDLERLLADLAPGPR